MVKGLDFARRCLPREMFANGAADEVLGPRDGVLQRITQGESSRDCGRVGAPGAMSRNARNKWRRKFRRDRPIA